MARGLPKGKVKRNRPANRISIETRNKIKELWESGVSSLQLSQDFKLRDGSIRVMAKRGGWVRPAMIQVPEPEEKPGLPASLEANPDQLTTFLGIIRNGGSVNLACKYAGVPMGTMEGWLKQRPELAAEVERAKSELPTKALQALERHMQTEWKAAQFILQSNPLTKQEYTPEPPVSKGGINVIIQFNRDSDEPTIIEGKAEPNRG